MHAWWMLVRKELRFTFPLAVWMFGAAVFVGLFDVYLAYKQGGGAATVLIVVLLALLTMYLPGYLVYSMFKEMKGTGATWLSLPQNGWVLIGAKLAAGLLYLLATLAVLYGFGMWTISVDGTELMADDLAMMHLHRALLENPGFVIADHVGVSLYNAMWALLLVMVTEAVKYRIGKWRWLIALGIFILPPFAIAALMETETYQALLMWGAVQTPYPPLTTVRMAESVLYAGEMLFYIAQIAVLYGVSGWLLDRKTEV